MVIHLKKKFFFLNLRPVFNFNFSLSLPLFFMSLEIPYILSITLSILLLISLYLGLFLLTEVGMCYFNLAWKSVKIACKILCWKETNGLLVYNFRLPSVHILNYLWKHFFWNSACLFPMTLLMFYKTLNKILILTKIWFFCDSFSVLKIQ